MASAASSESCLRQPRVEIMEKHPASITAIDCLRRSRIPDAASFNLSYPGADVNSVIVAIVALVEHLDGPSPSVAIANIEKYWSSVIHPWVVFLLRQICREPSPPKGVDAFETILATMPPLLALPSSYPEDTHPTSHSSDSAIRPLVAQIWLQTVERYHTSWGPWSGLMTNMAESWPAFVAPLGYPNDSNLGYIFLRHLKRLTKGIATLPTSLVTDLADFLCVISLDGDIQESSLGRPSLRGAVVPALVRVISGVICKRKISRSAGDRNNERVAARRLVHVAAHLLLLVVDDPNSVAKALGAGILKAVINAPGWVFTESDSASCATLFRLVLDNISIFLAWPLVLRHFLKAGKRIPVLGRLEMKLKAKNESIWEAWERTKAKANELGGFRRELKEQVSPLCNYDQCPGTKVETKPDYLHCTGCFRAIYCSAGCQKSHWKSGHREFCINLKVNEESDSGDMARARLTGREIQFFRACQRKYVLQSIFELLKLAGTKENLVFLFNFDSRELPTLKDFKTLFRDQLHTLASDERWKGSLAALTERCRLASNDETIIATTFPKSHHDIWLVVSGIEFGSLTSTENSFCGE
ncbi:hypothetical protein V5O48_012718 [Marasmius crinis-equi]|uniref:MYND-type domain-containing protein n=1 Tax=Marasmius crinis-equi TaxID=585013 RepID=A0ABR3F208_9AGAR